MPDIAQGPSASSFRPDLVNHQSLASSGVPPYDAGWVESRTKKAALKLEQLDADLKNYKSNSIKQSIRRGHSGARFIVCSCLSLGDHYLDCGDLNNALKCYSRVRDYCTTGRHVINMCLNVIKVAVYLQNPVPDGKRVDCGKRA